MKFIFINQVDNLNWPPERVSKANISSASSLSLALTKG